MTEKVISSLHIQKLGHEIQEIRERALFNIISKLDHGFTFDNDLARSKEILSKLFEWFLLEPCRKQEVVLSLIKRILQSESGKTLINHHGTITFKNELKQIRSFIEPRYYPILDEILQILNESNVIVPPLETDVPLSYRTTTNSSRPVETTATTIEGFIQQEPSQNECSGLQSAPKSRNDVMTPLKWQNLIEPDRHVLQSIENSLRNPPQPASLLHSADFFTNILLQDFPAEVFLQRPTIVLTFYDLICDCPSTRVVNSVLNCLYNLTKALQVRINHYSDPCMSNSKDNNADSQIYSTSSSPESRKTGSGQSVEGFPRYENVDYLKTQQISFSQYCFSTFRCIFKYLCVKPETIKQTKRRSNQRGVNLALSLLGELLNLLVLVVKDSSGDDVRRQMNDILIGYGSCLEFFRVEATSDDSDLSNRVTQLCLLHHCTNFLLKMVPLTQTGLILPRNLKNALTNSLVDVTLAKLYPDLYNTLLDYVQSFRLGVDSEAFTKYHETKRICESMTAAAQFMKNYKSLDALEGIDLAKKALPSLEFHKTDSFVKQIIEICANKLPLFPYDDEILEKFECVMLKLLAHNLEKIRQETYRLCQKKIVAAIGPRLNTSRVGVPGAQILFLLKSSILIEIACHGLTSDNLQIRNHAEDILIHIIKCKILVSEDIWNKVVEALITSLPILLCYADKASSLGRSLFDIIDPDTATTLFLPKNEVIRGNILILFSTDVSMREEAFSRLCWLLASQKDSREMLPRLNNLYDKALPNACQIQKMLDINKNRSTQHFYQPSSLQQVLDLLKAPNVEPVIRRSALTQISVMMEDSILHSTFMERGGLEIVLNVMTRALVEKNFNDYPDSVIPAISVLKNLCLYQVSARQALSVNTEVYYNVLRSLFLFFAEDKLKYDAVCLLFLLIFSDFIKGTPSKANFSIPYIVSHQLRVPFSCSTHWEISPHYEESLVALLSSDKWCLSSIQIQWNSEIFEGLDEILSWNEVCYDNNNIVEILKLNNYDLKCLKASSVSYYIKRFLTDIQNGTTHDFVIASINRLTTYIQLSKFMPQEENFLEYPWEETFQRFLKLLPSSEEDAKLLSCVLKFLTLLTPFYKSSEDSFWLSQMLKNPASCLLDLITLEPSSPEEFKALSHDLLNLITLCASQEQHFLDYYTYTNPRVSKDEVPSWINVIEIISNSLKFNDSTHFYNLAYLDSLLSCLLHLTATLKWSGSKSGTPPKNFFYKLISSLCELIVVFHCGKGPTAAISVMGLSITRHVILILNHLLAEMHSCKLKNWESCFTDVEEDDWLKSFLVLWSSRDVLIRAGALQFFAGLATSPLLAINIVNELKNEGQGVWHRALTVLVDHDEASVVRENSAFLLAHLIQHVSLNPSPTSLIPNTMRKGKDDVTTVFELLEEYQFSKNLVRILSALYTNHVTDFDSYYHDDSSSSSKSSRKRESIVTPSFVKSIAILLLNLLNLNQERFSYKLQDFGLVKLLFKCICDPSMSISDTKKLSLYCEIMEMDATVCSLLSQVAQISQTCLGTLLHTKDCLSGAISLLNPNIYHTHLPQLVYLRNRLWSELFKLISVLTNSNLEHYEEALKILCETIVESGREAFIDTLCEATRSMTFNGKVLIFCDCINVNRDAYRRATSLLVKLLTFCPYSDQYSVHPRRRIACKLMRIQSQGELLDHCLHCSLTIIAELQNSALLSLTSLLGVESRRIFKITPTSQVSGSSSIQNILDTVRTSSSTALQGSSDAASVAGAEICKILLNLYDLCSLKVSKDLLKKKSMIASSLTSVLCVSQEAKKYAYHSGLVGIIMKQLRDFHVKLSLESVDALRRVLEKKRVCPLLKELDEVIGLITNFMVGDETVKSKFAELGLSDLIHKLWVWFSLQKLHLINVLKMMCTFTTDCHIACQSLPLTSCVAGSGPRKLPSKVSLLHAIMNLIEREMDLVSKTHSLNVLELSFIILTNCSAVLECRVLYCKSTLLQNVARLHPAITKKQKPWDHVELIWLEFLQTFSLYPEGQSCIARFGDVFDLLLALTYGTKSLNKITALLVLRNTAFYQPNRARLLTSGDFLNLLKCKLETGNFEEKSAVVLIIWSLAANNQKAKLIFKAAQLDTKLQEVLMHYRLSEESISSDEIERIQYVLNVLRDNDKIS